MFALLQDDNYIQEILIVFVWSMNAKYEGNRLMRKFLWKVPKAFRLIDSPPVTECLLLVLRPYDALIDIPFSCFHANCSTEFANCIPWLLVLPWSTFFCLCSFLASYWKFWYVNYFIFFNDKTVDFGNICICLFYPGLPLLPKEKGKYKLKIKERIGKH